MSVKFTTVSDTEPDDLIVSDTVIHPRVPEYMYGVKSSGSGTVCTAWLHGDGSMAMVVR